MKRREFITLLGSAATTWPVSALAQRGEQMKRIGILTNGAAGDPDYQARIAAFLEGLQSFGWIDGRNVRIDTRWGTGNAADVKKFATELVALAPDVILATGTTLGALQQATRTVPIVFALSADPVGAGYVDSLARPGGNMTGFMLFEFSLSGKWLELLKEIAPRVNRVAFLFNPATATYAEYYLKPFKAVAPSLGLDPIASPVHDPTELESAIAAQAREPDGALIIMPDTFTDAHRTEITSQAARYHLPAVCPFRFYAEVGCLLSYGNEAIDNFRRAAQYADRILKGEKPSDLPVQAPVNFVLTINLKTAKALGLDVPALLQQRADEVIE